MKKIIITTAVIIMTAIYSQAQQKTTASTQGYWVIESNIHQPKKQTVYFYNDENQLIYQETITCKLKAQRKKTQKALNNVLARINTQSELTTTKNLLAVTFKLEK